MAREVNRVSKREAEGLDHLPTPAIRANALTTTFPTKLRRNWVAHQTILIKNRFLPIEPKARAFLVAEIKDQFGGSWVTQRIRAKIDHLGCMLHVSV